MTEADPGKPPTLAAAPEEASEWWTSDDDRIHRAADTDAGGAMATTQA